MPNDPNRDWHRTMAVFHETYGPGPWPCEYCDEPIEKIGRHSRDGNVHHRDEDAGNDAPGNLAIAHAGCHQRHHHAGKPHTAEHSAKVGRKGRMFTDEWRRRLSEAQRMRFTREPNPFKGHKHTAESKARMSEAKKRNREAKAR